MPKKSIILSDDNGGILLTNTSSVYIEDSNLSVTSSQIYVDDIKITNLQPNRLIYASGTNNILNNVINTSTTDGGCLVWNGILNQWSASSTIVETYTGTAGGDLSGSFLTGVQVKNINNVNLGTLSGYHGGTGLINPPIGKNVLLVASGSGVFYTISSSQNNSGSYVACTENGWTIIPPSYLPDVRFYTSGSTGNTFTWNKPAGARFARVILQGAGGGGGGGHASTLNYFGAGGGSGGFTDVVLEISDITSEAVITGIGGAPGAVGSNGSAGSATMFGNLYTSTAGGGGGAGSGAATNNGTRGIGLTKSGGSGSASSVNNAEIVYGMPSGGGRGPNNGGTIVPVILNGNRNFGYYLSSDGLDLSNILILSSGSRGDSITSTGYGAGGGGGVINGAGKSGGNGYALIISW